MDDNAVRNFGVVVQRGADGVTTVYVRGDLDLAGAPEFHAAADAALADGASTVVIDFSEITFIDSTGLGALVRIHTAATDSGRTMRLVKVPQVAARTITIGGLASLLGVDSTEPTA
jgi:anti-sigma B factor antagonist